MTDAEGAFHFEGQLPGRYDLTARAADGKRGRLSLTVTGGDIGGLTVRLDAEVVVEGRVIDAAGAAVAGARVAAYAEPWGMSGGPRPVAATTSTADGRFRFTGLERGMVGIRAEQAAAGTGTWGGEMLDWGTRREVIVRLETRASLAGTVRFDDGRPAPGAVVYAESPNNRERASMRAVAGPDGRYALTGLNPGPHRITASREGGHARFRPDVAWTPIAENEQKQLDLVVPRRETIKGTVRLPDETSAAGAVVIAGIGDYKPLTGSALRAVADERGRFTLDDLDQDVIYTLWADLPGFAEAQVRGILAGNRDVVLDLGPESVIAGVVVDAQGRPVTDFDILCAQDLGSRAVTPTRRLSQAIHHPRGEFELRPLAAGTYKVEARAPDGRRAELSVRLAAGERRGNVRLVLGGLMTVKGTVLDDAKSAPLAGVAVHVQSDGGPGREGRPLVTDAGGRFEIPDVPQTPTIALAFQIADPAYLQEVEYVLVPGPADSLDVGTIRLVRGNLKDRIGSGPRGMIGIEFARQGADVVLTQIRPNTPAERAGLRPGDRVISADGRSLAGLGHTGRSYVVAGPAGKPITLVVQSTGTPPRPVTVIRDAFAPSGK
jgi:protocatechuate 3,4-dioxygenase beta subunit